MNACLFKGGAIASLAFGTSATSVLGDGEKETEGDIRATWVSLHRHHRDLSKTTTV